MWEKTNRNLFFVAKGVTLPKLDTMFVTPAVSENVKCYAVFHRNDLKRELALFGNELEIVHGRPELIEQASAAIKDHGWCEVRGPNGLPWHVAMPRKVERREPWGVLFFGPCISDLGALGWCLFNDEGVLLYSFEFRHQEGINAKFISDRQSLPLWHLALSQLWGIATKNN